MGRLAQLAAATRVLASRGLVGLERPDRLAKALLGLRRWGLTPAAGYAASAARFPIALGILDDAGQLSFSDIDRRTNALARAWSAVGIDEDDVVGILCRNHRGFVEATVAAAKLGADTLYLNTGFAPPQIGEVAEREGMSCLVHDAEFELPELDLSRGRFVAWGTESDQKTRLEALAGGQGEGAPPRPPAPSKAIMLTSGTTGKPKGARPGEAASLMPAVAILERIPLRARETTLISVPLFHAWGFGIFRLGHVLSSTHVLQRRFDPEATLAAIGRRSVTALVAVPAILQQLVDLPEEIRRRYDTSTLRVVMTGSAPLSPQLAERFMDRFGELLYNFYGATEFAWATIATPQELRHAPGTSGRAPFGTTVRILDDENREVPTGNVGHVHVGNEMLFEGYTSGASAPELVDGLMPTGDRGRLDERGLLFLEGRADEMIISGGENVYPEEVERELIAHSAVVDAAVIGVEDERFGQRLRAIVVPATEDNVDAEDLKVHVGTNLANYKVPREIVFVEQLPRTPTGKLLRRELERLNER